MPVLFVFWIYYSVPIVLSHLSSKAQIFYLSQFIPMTLIVVSPYHKHVPDIETVHIK